MGKKIGYFSLGVAVFLAALVLTVIVQTVVAFPATFKVGLEAGMQGITDRETITEMSMEALQDVLPYCVLASHISYILVFSLWYHFGCGRPSLKKVNYKSIFAPKLLVGTVLIGVGMCYFMNFALELVFPYIPENIMNSYLEMMEQAQMGTNIVSIIAAVFLAPIGEELIFRGVLFHYCKKAVEDMSNRTAAFWIANIVQAFFFGCLHMNLVQGTYAFLLGLVIGYVGNRFKSVLPCVLVHFLFNGVSTLTGDAVTEILSESVAVLAILTVVTLVVVAVGMVMIKEKRVLVEAEA